ncbi:sensor histidine kinase [Nocardia arizonensis]|uniref:sensor histidine kinase n=2 Tax=Nocardia arizonensis TaxID=1141647 RepID=UPI001FD3DEE5|nr:nitrate- and nitrite sensing domain-containing protein [Nocardia arizonensis]
MLAIVLIPSVALLSIGIGAAVYLVKDGRKDKDWAEFASDTTAPAISMIEAFQLERGATLLYLSQVPQADEHLASTRRNSDSTLASLQQQGTKAAMRPEINDDMAGIQRLYQALPQLRAAVDSRAMPPEQAFTSFSAIIDTIVHGTLIGARVAPDAQIAVDLYRAVHPLRAAEAISKSATIGTTALLTNQFTATQLSDFTRNVGDARGEVTYAAAVLTGKRREQLEAITNSATYQQLSAMEDAVIRRGVVIGEEASAAEDAPSGRSSTNSSTGATTRRANQTSAVALPLNADDWGNAAGQVRTQLLELWNDQSRDAHRDAEAIGDRKASDSLYGGIAVGALTLVAFLAALFLANRLIARMRRLRRETLQLADERLPGTIRTLSDGEQIDQNAEIAPLDFGGDEIGQIADAFNRAHSAAVTAAVAESKTRSGVNAVFLNIAHRSQVMVHRQLALLDRAEREEEDPGKLDLLFQLDHLATRARRNAENLIILGGEKPGRRWRNPVALIDVVRSAVAESLDYTRIQTGRLPDIRITGATVADLIHLIAELTDNATAFSPPESRVEVSGNLVGKGVAIEISDQGLGMSDTELAERNALLADPPDFSVAALSSDARLGLFVVAKLAIRHGISVRLSESDYGGIRAIVLVPTALLASDNDSRPTESPTETTAPRAVLAPAAVSTAPAGASHTAAVAAPPQNIVEKPALPRRRRAIPEAAGDSATDGRTSAESTRRPRSADEARSLMSAIENGTRQGRSNRVDNDGSAQQFDRQEGTGDDLQTP